MFDGLACSPRCPPPLPHPLCFSHFSYISTKDILIFSSSPLTLKGSLKRTRIPIYQVISGPS